MAFIDQIVTLGKDIPSCLGFVFLTVAAIWATKIEKVIVLLLEVTQAMGQ
jgi:hypothetical protein